MADGGRTNLTFSILAVWVIISAGNYSEEITNITSRCSCKRDTPSTLIINCDEFNGTLVSACFLRYDQTEELIFKNSSLVKIPLEIETLKTLRRIDFSDNHLTFLAVPGVTCSMLTHVYVNYNNTTVLKKGSLNCFTNLQFLNITNNRLRRIENGPFNTNLKSFQNRSGC